MRGPRPFRLLLALLAAVVLATSSPVPLHAEAAPSLADSVLVRANAVMMSDPGQVLAITQEEAPRANALPAGRERVLARATLHWLRAEAYLRLDDQAKAVPEAAVALQMIAPYREPLKLRGDLLKCQGTLQMQRGNAAAALASYQQSFAIFQQLGDARSQALVLQYIGSLYTAANDSRRAEKYYRQAADTFSGDPMLSLALHNNLGNTLLQLDRHGEAEIEYLKSLAIARQLRNPVLEAHVLGNLARNQVEAGRFDAADATLQQAFLITRDGEARASRPQLYVSAASVAYRRGDYARAEQMIDAAFRGMDLKATPSIFRDAHMIAYKLFSARGDLRRALTHLEAVKRLDDSDTKVAATTGAALMAARFDYANQELRIANLQAEELRRSVAYERSRAAMQRTIFIGLGVATLIVFALLTFLLINMRRSRDRIRAANTVLAETNVALEKALAAKTEFLATTSHEIRTPLNGILGMTQVMLSDPALPAETRDRIGIVHGAGVTMRALVDDILDVAKMETGNLTVDPAPMDLPAALKEVTRMWEEQAHDKGLAFALDLADSPSWIVSDSGRLRQIVFNLLSNALKFTESGEVRLRAEANGEGDARRLRLIVSDTGIGIPADKRDAIFESFKQADSSTTRKFGGTGLGLTICRNLARALGGDISVASDEGRGSRFTVDLPLVAAEAPAAAAAAVCTVLVVDRNPIARSMLRTLIEQRGASAKFTADVEEAGAMLAAGGITRVLADEATLRAGDGDVFARIEALAAAARDAGAESIVLWAQLDDSTRDRLLAAGVGQVIGKPVGGAALIEKIVPEAEQNCGAGAQGPLVSRAA